MQLFSMITRQQGLSNRVNNWHVEGQRRHGPDTMSTNATDKTEESTVERSEDCRYGELTIGDEEHVIYDRENHQAWIQSTVVVPVEELS